jgi:hypothetical protein
MFTRRALTIAAAILRATFWQAFLRALGSREANRGANTRSGAQMICVDPSPRNTLTRGEWTAHQFPCRGLA